MTSAQDIVGVNQVYRSNGVRNRTVRAFTYILNSFLNIIRHVFKKTFKFLMLLLCLICFRAFVESVHFLVM